jgi:putative MATE family efflux protein
MMVGLLAENLVGVISTAFLGHVGDLELGAAAIASTYYVILFVVGMGFGTGTQILIARRNGEGNYKKIGGIFENSLYFIWFFSALTIVFSFLFSRQILTMMLSSEEIVDAAMRYLDIRIFTLFFSLGCVIMRSFFVGIEVTKYIGMGALVVAGSNCLFDYLLIFGKHGFPEMGLEGAAWAAMIAEVAGFIYFLWIIWEKVNLSKYAMFVFQKPQWQVMLQTMKLAVFTMLQNLLSLSTWFLFFVIIEKTGDDNLAASNIIRSFYILAICPLWAYGSTVSTLVSNALGQNHFHHVFPIIRKVAVFSVITALVAYIPILVSAKWIMGFYTENQHLIDIGFKAMFVVGFANVLSAVAWTIFSAISATGNTMMAMFLEAFTLACYLGSIHFFALHYPHNLEVIWSAEIVYQIVLGLLSLWYFSSKHWTRKRI